MQGSANPISCFYLTLCIYFALCKCCMGPSYALVPMGMVHFNIIDIYIHDLLLHNHCFGR